MAFAAHDRALLLFKMASFAVRMKGLFQARFFIGAFFIMAISATLVFRRLVFQFYPIFINMVAFVAIFQPGGFVMRVMPKNNRGTLFFGKTAIIYHLHVFLRKCR